MNRIWNKAAIILEVLLYAGAYIFQYFTRKKMGMARFVIYKNHGWENQYPLSAIKYGILIVLAALFLIEVILYVRQKPKRIHNGIQLLVSAAAVSVCASWIMTQSTSSARAYYFLALFFAAAAVIQLLRACLSFSGGHADQVSKKEIS